MRVTKVSEASDLVRRSEGPVVSSDQRILQQSRSPGHDARGARRDGALQPVRGNQLLRPALGHHEPHRHRRCPCDEVVWKAELPAATEAGVELLAKKLARIAPRLADAAVRRSWACLRTFTPDRAPVVGAEPRVGGLLWLAGHGMTGGVAAGELLASTYIGKAHKLAQALSPARFAASPN